MPHVAARRLELPPRISRRLVPRWAGPAVAVAICGALVLAFGGAYWDGYQLRRGAARLARERDELRLQNAQLREELRLLRTPEYIERLAREQLGLVRPGEIAVILVRPTPAAAPPAAPPGTREAGRPEVREPKPWWARLLGR
ncbi:MAG: FtsB family cell division protein [Armatimonadota bacterium]